MHLIQKMCWDKQMQVWTNIYTEVELAGNVEMNHHPATPFLRKDYQIITASVMQ